LLLLFSGLQLVPGIVTLFPRDPVENAAPKNLSSTPAKLVRLLPGFVPLGRRAPVVVSGR